MKPKFEGQGRFPGSIKIQTLLPWLTAAAAFVLLNGAPLSALAADWWREPDAGHGLLLVPLAFIIAWKTGLNDRARPQPWLGLGVLSFAVVLRYVADLAAEFYSLRMSILLMLVALTIFAFGWRQIRHWWLPATLLVLSIPLPQVVIADLALPLQLKASAIGAALLAWREVPVQLAGNVIYLPGQSLFVTEACSGLRSLSALLAMGVLISALWLNGPWLRVLILVLTIPIAVLINGFRVFVTGYLVYYVNPELGSGLVHWTEGWVLYVVALAAVGSMTALVRKAEQWRKPMVAA